MGRYIDILGTDVKKDKAYYDDCALYLSSIVSANDDFDKAKVVELRQAFYNVINQQKYEPVYNPLIKEVKDVYNEKLSHQKIFKTPLQIKNIPILHSRIKALIGEELIRPKDFKVSSTDIIANENKMEAFRQLLFEQYVVRYNQNVQMLQTQQQALELKKQLQINELEGISDQEKQQMIQQLDTLYLAASEKINNQIILNQKEFDKLKREFERTYKTSQDVLMSMLIEWNYEFNKLNRVFSNGWREKLINDWEVYYVDWDFNSKHPIIRNIPREYLTLPNNVDVPRIHQLDYAILNLKMNVGAIIAEFGNKVDKDTVDYIRANMNNLGGTVTKSTFDFFGNPIMFDSTFNYPNNHNTVSNGESVNISKCYWKSLTPVYFKVLENKFDKMNPSAIVEVDEAEYKKNVGKGKYEYQKRFRQDLNYGVVINRDRVLFSDVHPIQVRINDGYTYNWLPFVGKNNSIVNPCISIFEIGLDIQEMINILYFHVNTLIFLSGVKGIVYDLSQKPLDMDLSEVLFYRSQGITLIETLDDQGKMRTSFNQFQNYDDTISNGLSAILSVIETYKALLNEIIGVPDSRAAIIDASARVGNTKHEYRQSLVITESLLVEHEEAIEDAYTRLAMLNTIAYRNGYNFGQFYSSSEKMTKMLSIPPNVLTSEFKVMITVGRRASEEIKEIKEIAKKQLVEGKIKDSQFLQLISTNDLNSMIELVLDYEKDYEQLLDAKEQRNAQMQQQVIEQQTQRELQLRQLIESMKTEREREKNEILKQKLLIDQYIKEKEIQTWNKDIDIRAEVDLEAINKDANVELAYLKQQDIIDKKNIELRSADMFFNQVSQKINRGQPKEKIKD